MLVISFPDQNYCSNVCFEASVRVCDQISFTPLYLRGQDSHEELLVVVPDSATLEGKHGDLKDIGGEVITRPSGAPAANARPNEL